MTRIFQLAKRAETTDAFRGSQSTGEESFPQSSQTSGRELFMFNAPQESSQFCEVMARLVEPRKQGLQPMADPVQNRPVNHEREEKWRPERFAMSRDGV